MTLPPPLDRHYERFADAIAKRLRQFAAPKDEREVFYEFCYCICTPQSKARHAWQVERILREREFFERPFDPTPVLADRTHYIRFHRTKAARLLALRERFGEIVAALNSTCDARQLRTWITDNVEGFGMKEASHVLRNLGRFELAILDRHILRHLEQLGVIATSEPPRNRLEYEAIESAFSNFASRCSIELQALDLLLWAIEAGEVLK